MKLWADVDVDSVPVGTHVIVWADPQRHPLIVLNSDTCQVGDGELVITTKGGNFVHALPGVWMAVGTIEEDAGARYIALDTFAERAA